MSGITPNKKKIHIIIAKYSHRTLVSLSGGYVVGDPASDHTGSVPILTRL